MLEINDKEKFAKIIAEAISAAHQKCSNASLRDRWIRAIARAVVEIENNGAFMQYFAEDHYLLIWSQGSDEIYSANGVCQCYAFVEHHVPCWHRAASRLIRNYFGCAEENKTPRFPSRSRAPELSNIPPEPASLANEMDNAIYLTPFRKEEAKVGGFRL